jgi:predicted ATPase
MKLKSFRVRKFRNIVDSGEIQVDPDVTCFVGKNEAGKSGLLEALYLLNPAYGEKLDASEQYPRWLVAGDRRAGELGDHYPIAATFELEDADLEAVIDQLGEGVLTDTTLTISRRYGGPTKWWLNRDEEAAIQNVISDLPTEVAAWCKSIKSLEALRAVTPAEGGPTKEDVAVIRTALTQRNLHDGTVWNQIYHVLSSRVPKFFRFTEYSGLSGRVDLRELAGDGEGPGRSRLQTARALLALAGTEMDQLANENYELRKSEIEAVQIDLSHQVFRYWKQNPDLEVLIDIDKETVRQSNGQSAVARFLDIRLRDKRTGYSNNFSQRSSGFQWFFSFLAGFSEFESHAITPIVLLDEPALTLHGKAQADFLRFINERLAPSTIVLYTTHSPFMIEPDKLERVRIVEDKGPPAGAVCSPDILASDPDSLFPLQAALGYDIAQTLFVGPNNLVVEGTSDLVYLNVMSQACGSVGKPTLDPRWRSLPAGSAANIPTFVSLVGPHLDVTVLADGDTQGMQRINNMIAQKLLSGHRLILAGVATGNREADIEDLFTEGDYLKLYNATYGKSLKVADLPAGPRIVKRIEAKEGKYIHGEVAETLLRQHRDFNFTATTLEHFSKLFQAINATLAK